LPEGERDAQLDDGSDQDAQPEQQVNGGEPAPFAEAGHKLRIYRAEDGKIEGAGPDFAIHAGEGIQAGADEQLTQGADSEIDAQQRQCRSQIPALDGINLAEQDHNAQHTGCQVEQRGEQADEKIGAVGGFLLKGSPHESGDQTKGAHFNLLLQCSGASQRARG